MQVNLLFRQAFAAVLLLVLTGCNPATRNVKEPVDYVNPYMGNISHLLVPTYPTVQLPNGMMRIYPEREIYTTDRLRGLPMLVTSHRGASAFTVSPWQGNPSDVKAVQRFSYDNEKVTPYQYSVYLDEATVAVEYAPASQAALYSFSFEGNSERTLAVNTRNGEMKATENGVSGFQNLDNNTKVYLWAETSVPPVSSSVIQEGRGNAVVLHFGAASEVVGMRYGISYISVEQARKNLDREIGGYDIAPLAAAGRTAWNDALGRIRVEGGSENDKAVFYTSLYRTYERMINISEDGRYYNVFDGQVHDDDGTPFYTDDWIWDTYLATHPLRMLIEPEKEQYMINSYLRMAQHSPDGWLPTFPGVAGDGICMNGNHSISVFLDAYRKGLTGFDFNAAYQASLTTLNEKSILPWRRVKKNDLDRVYLEQGFFPSLHPGEKETNPDVHSFEKRQTIAITLAAAFDDWCLSEIAREQGHTAVADSLLQTSYNYRAVYNKATGFFHPRDSKGNLIEPFDYRFAGGQGGRDYYDENNGWIFRWNVQHNIGDLINLMGGTKAFATNLDAMYDTSLGMSRYAFYTTFPDHTGNVGQFSMANEPCLHIPYLYNYAGQPWKTQKRIRELLDQWFRNDLMGVPGDEDGGGLSAFVVFSQMGFYPVTPGLPMYNIGSPIFSKVEMDLGNGKVFEIVAENCNRENKYIQSATLNGVEWNKPWFSHSDIANGGKLVLVMGDRANRQWGSAADAMPPSGAAY